MSAKELKGAERKPAPTQGRGTRPACPPPVVLVGTYRPGQLEAWPDCYNYPLYDGEKLDPEACKRVNELWLFSGTKDQRTFRVECLGVKTREELVRDYGYKARGKGHGDGRYLLFRRVKELYVPSKGEAECVIVRTRDFAGQNKNGATVQKQLKAYLESPDRKDPLCAKRLPTILTKLPPNVLRVCEAAVQMDFLVAMDVSQTYEMTRTVNSLNLSEVKDERLTCLDFFAGSGLVTEGLSTDFRTVWANDISPKKALVFNANNRDGVLQVCPIENIAGGVLPSVDMSWGSFPCQDLSLAGDIKGLYASRSGLFWQWLRVMDEMSEYPQVVVAENVVGLVSAASGQYYVVVHDELLKRGYQVGAVMLDAASWLPQSRKRIFVIGVQKGTDISTLSTNGPTWCHPDPVVKVAKLVRNWVWWKMPSPGVSHTKIEDIIDFECPCDSDVEHKSKLALISPEKLAEIRAISRNERRVFTGYRRTRNHKQVLEVRTDGMAGCLRTPGGGSSRQILIIASNGQIKTRLLTVRETARLMGAPDSYLIPGTYNDGYMAMGDAVAVPVVRYLSEHLLAPLVRKSR